MSFESTLRGSLNATAAGMPPNPERARQVARRASRGSTLRGACAALGAVAAAVTVVFIGRGVAGGPTKVPLAASPSPAGKTTVAFDRVHAIPGGLRIEFVGSDPSLPSTSTCGATYTVRSEPAAEGGVLRVTLVAQREPAASGTGICHGAGFPRSIDVVTERTYSAVVDSTTGIRHDVGGR